MIPMVFCPSLVPCAQLKSAEDTSCRRRNSLSDFAGGVLRKVQWTISIISQESAIPIIGESTMNTSVVPHLPGTSAPKPALATAAPA